MPFAQFAADLIIAADTVVVLDDCILEKPASPADAKEMLRRLAGRQHGSFGNWGNGVGSVLGMLLCSLRVGTYTSFVLGLWCNNDLFASYLAPKCIVNSLGDLLPLNCERFMQ